MKPTLFWRLRAFLGRKRIKRQATDPWDLLASLLRWSRDDVWTLRDAFEGTIILGQTGSGKSTGSGAAIARAMLEAGFGGLVLTAKPDERAVWECYMRDCGRSADLLVFGPTEPLRFGFLDYELRRKGVGAGLTENIVNLFSNVLEVAERNASGGGGREDEGYWRRSLRQLVRNLVDLLVLSKGRVSVPELYRLVVSIATSPEQVKSEAWRASSFCFRCLTEADRREKTPQQRSDFELVTDYLCLEFPALSDKTRSVIVSTFTSLVDVLNRGILRELFSGETNVTPDVTLDGKVLLIDLPVKEFLEVGVFAQLLWKQAFQRFSERRNLAENRRPLFLWADEAHHWVTSQDALYQTTCRSARVATVLLTQNVGNFQAALGGSEKGKAEAASLFGNLNTKVFHSNGDPVTNEWASTIIGRTRQYFANGSSSQQADDWVLAAMGMNNSAQTSGGFSEAYELTLQPSAFSGLRTGGPENARLVDAIVFQSGKRFKAGGRNWLPVTFQQGDSR